MESNLEVISREAIVENEKLANPSECESANTKKRIRYNVTGIKVHLPTNDDTSQESQQK